MGQTLGKDEAVQTKENFYKKYQLVEEKQDQHYGTIKVFEKNYDSEEEQQQDNDDKKDKVKKIQRLFQKAKILAIKESVYQDQETMERDQLNMKQLIQITENNHNEKKTQNLVDVYEYFIQSEEKFCSSVQRIQLVMEYLQRDIQVEVKTKKLQNQRFTPQEIFTVAFSCINSLYNLQQYNLAHGDLKTSNILVSEYFEIKMLHPSINKIVPSFAQIIAQMTCGEAVETSGIYLSPILTKTVGQQNYQPQHNPFKSDVFTLGVILIECCNLGVVDDLYNYEAGEFKENQLKIHLTMIKNQYGIDVHDLIAKMVQIQEQDRPDFIELASQLNITSHINEVFNQQQQMIEQQTALKKNFADKHGVSLFRALNTEAEEYNYNQKQNSSFHSFSGNNQSLQNSTVQPNNILSSQHPTLQSAGGISQSNHNPGASQNNSGPSQMNPAITQSNQTQAGLTLFQNNFNSYNSVQSQNQQNKPNAFFPQQQYGSGNSINQSISQSQQQNAIQQRPPAQPQKNESQLSRKQSQETLGLSQPHNFTTINQTQVTGVTQIKSSNLQTLKNQNSSQLPQTPVANPHTGQQLLQNQSQHTNISTPQQHNNISVNPNIVNFSHIPTNSNPVNQLGQSQNQMHQNNYQNFNPSYLQNSSQNQITQLNNNAAISGYQPGLGITQPQLSYSGYPNTNQFQYDPNKVVGISLSQNKSNNIPLNNQLTNQPQTQNNPAVAQNYQIPEDVQKIINEFKQKQIQNDQLYQEKEKIVQNSLKYSVIQRSANESPLSQNKLERNASKNVLNLSPQGQQGALYNQQKQQLDLILSQQQQNNQLYNQQQIPQQIMQSQAIPIYQQPQVQQNFYQNPIAISQQQQQQQYGNLVSQQNQFFQNNQNINPQQYQFIQNNNIGGQQFNPQMQQNQNFSTPTNQMIHSQQMQQASNTQTSDSQRNKYEHIHETYDDQSHYIGEKLGGLRHGTGKFFYADGGYYEGEWCEGRMEGLGTLYYPSGSLAYLGQWRNDQFNGKGTVYNESPAQIIGEFDYTNFDNLGEFWVKYEGDFKDDNKEGIGTIYLSNGDRFTGNFNNDFVHGQGTYFRENKNPVSGIWDCNHLIQYL